MWEEGNNFLFFKIYIEFKKNNIENDNHENFNKGSLDQDNELIEDF